MNGISKFGGSLPVENVQALASKDPKHVPARYLRPELETDVSPDDESLGIPIIDFGRLLQDQEFGSKELPKLHSACQDWGFFQLINHGVPEEVIKKMKNDTEEFFRLPLEEKKAYSQLPNNVQGYGQAFVISEEQKLDWGDMLFFRALPVDNRDMRFIPNNPISYRETINRYSVKLHRIAVSLVGLMAKNLGLEPEKLTNIFENGGTQGLRMNYYPPCLHSNKVLGLSPHSDATGLTILLQVNDVQGLHIRKNGNWLSIKPIPGAFIVNIGDIIEIMSNGIYKSIEHRAVINPEKERLSIAAFHGPRFGTPIGPSPYIIKGNKGNYMTVSHDDYMKQVFNTKLDGKSSLDLMKV